MSIDTAVQALVQSTVSAMLPQIVAAVQQQLGAQPAAAVQAAVAQPAAAAIVQPQPAAADPFGGLGTPAPTAASAVTAEMVQQLIMPLVSNDTFKAQLTAEMNAMGIANLPDARPDQLPELYARFQRVAAGAGGAAPAAQPAAANTII